MDNTVDPAVQSPFDIFQEGLRKIVNAPKSEVDRRMAEEQAKRKTTKNTRKKKQPGI